MSSEEERVRGEQKRRREWEERTQSDRDDQDERQFVSAAARKAAKRARKNKVA